MAHIVKKMAKRFPTGQQFLNENEVRKLKITTIISGAFIRRQAIPMIESRKKKNKSTPQKVPRTSEEMQIQIATRYTSNSLLYT